MQSGGAAAELVASYPGLLTPAFVACGTNTGGGLVKLITCNDVRETCGGGHIPSVQLKSALWNSRNVAKIV